MKQLLVFIFLLCLVFISDLKPVNLKSMRSDTIHVTVKGAVNEEGSYELERYSTVQDALKKAGINENTDTDTLNPDTVLKDHDVLNVPERPKPSDKQKISINTANEEELCTLSGIGQTTAQRIIEYRETNGLFQTIEDLMRVKGIGKSRFEKIRDQICL